MRYRTIDMDLALLQVAKGKFRVVLNTSCSVLTSNSRLKAALIVMASVNSRSETNRGRYDL